MKQVNHQASAATQAVADPEINVYSWWQRLRHGQPHFRKIVHIEDRPVKVEWTRRAQHALAQRDGVLYVEMQLYFSCMIVHHIRFHDRPNKKDLAWVNDKLAVYFHAVMKRDCDKEELFHSEIPFSDFPMVDTQRFIPKKVTLDYRHGQWQGEYGI